MIARHFPLLFGAMLITSAVPLARAESETKPAGYRAFEFRAVSADPKADGETDFKGRTAVLTTDERIAFLNAYTDYAAAWFGAPALDGLAVPPAETQNRLANLKPQPLPEIRRVLRLNDGWRQTGVAAHPTEPDRPWRRQPGVRVTPGEMTLPAGRTALLDLSASAGWRYEISWKAKNATAGSGAAWTLGDATLFDSRNVTGSNRSHDDFRVQVDMTVRRAYVSRDGVRIGEITLSPESGKAPVFACVSTGGTAITGLVAIDYIPVVGAAKSKEAPAAYTAKVLADDRFEPPVDLAGWTGENYDDSRWRPAALPCVHGGFREDGEDLYLRRRFDLDAVPARALLDVEALDPSGEIHINGELVATIPNRDPVTLDVARFLRAGSNVIAFKVNHNRVENPVSHANFDRAVGWFAGRTTLNLLKTPAAIRHVFSDTAGIRDGGATENVRVVLDNPSATPFEGTLEVAYRPWFPADGKIVARRTVPVAVKPGATTEIRTTTDLPEATPWTPEKPFLYAVACTLRDASGNPVDDTVDVTGVRTIAQKDGLLMLNGKPAVFVGAQIMGLRPYPAVEDSAKFNRCAPAATLMSELLAIKDMGGNLLRLHCHATKDSPDGIGDPRIAEMADQLGLAVFWAPPGWIREGDERHIDTDEIGAHIRRLYNHPSIVLWETSNHPNTFKRDDGPERTDAFVRRTVRAVLRDDTTRLIAPTTFWGHTHYKNDLGTLDWKGRPITAVPEYTHPLVTRGTQDAPTGYGAEWTALRRWPSGPAADCLKNHVRAWLNFEHEESAAQPNWSLATGLPWYRMRSYEAPYEKGSIGRILGFDEWRASQGWQAFSAYESMRKQLAAGVSAFSWCTIEGGANSGAYEKPLLDPAGHAKLAWYIHKMLTQPVFAGSADVDTVYGPHDTISPIVFNVGPARTADLVVTVRTPDGKVVDTRAFSGLKLAGGRSLLKLPSFRPKLPASGFCAVEYDVTVRQVRNRVVEKS